MPETETRVQGFIAMVYHYWGWGATREDAIARLRKAAPRDTSIAKGKRLIYQLPAGAVDPWVDDIGQIRWTWADDAPDKTANGGFIEVPKQR